VDEKIPVQYFIWFLGIAVTAVSAWLWRLHDGHHALVIKVAEKYVMKDDVHVIIKEFKDDNRLMLNEIKQEMRNDRIEIMGAIATKQDKT
jgi:hypothetical protein